MLGLSEESPRAGLQWLEQAGGQAEVRSVRVPKAAGMLLQGQRGCLPLSTSERPKKSKQNNVR